MLFALWGSTPYAWGERRHGEDHAMGRDAARIKNPAIQYVGAGVTFCIEEGPIITFGTTGAGFSRSRDGGDNR